MHFVVRYAKNLESRILHQNFFANTYLRVNVKKELVYVHKTTYDGEVKPSESELAGGRFWSIDEIKENIGKGVFTPNFEDEFTSKILPLL
jgi:hypothetical protein